MKASASIILRLLVGALVTAALVGWSPSAASTGVPVVRGSAPEPTSERKLARTSPRPSRATRVAGQPVLNIPRLDLKTRIGTDLEDGPAWWPVTGRPGGGDTIAVAGHRTTFTRPFYWLERLQPGDSIYIRWAGRTHAYRVSGRRILSAKQLHIADARGHEVLLLSACTPRGSARQRIVVYAWPQA